METSLVIGLLCIGAVAGGLIVAAWKIDKRAPGPEPIEHGPFAP